MNQNAHYKNLSKMFVCRFNSTFLHILKEPKMLPCGYTACTECIANALDKSGTLKCPFEKCKEKHAIKSIDSLIKNVMVNEIIDDNLVLIADHIASKIKRRITSFKGRLLFIFKLN